MTLAEWLTSNLPTEQDDRRGLCVVFTHPTDCGICGGHDREIVERIPVSDIAGRYNVDPATSSNPAQDLADAAKATGTGHERYFEQA